LRHRRSKSGRSAKDVEEDCQTTDQAQPESVTTVWNFFFSVRLENAGQTAHFVDMLPVRRSHVPGFGDEETVPPMISGLDLDPLNLHPQKSSAHSSKTALSNMAPM
jgi:hypothetical protein